MKTYYDTLREKKEHITSDPRGKKFIDDIIELGESFEQGVMALQWNIKDLDPAKLREGLFLLDRENYPVFTVAAYPVDENEKPIIDKTLFSIPVKYSPARKIPEDILERDVQNRYMNEVKIKDKFHFLSSESNFEEIIAFVPMSEDYKTMFFISCNYTNRLNPPTYAAQLIVENRIGNEIPILCRSEGSIITQVDENDKAYPLSTRLMSEIPKGEQLFVPEEKGQILIIAHHVVPAFDFTRLYKGFSNSEISDEFEDRSSLFSFGGGGPTKGIGGNSSFLSCRSPTPKAAERVKIDRAKHSTGDVVQSETRYEYGPNKPLVVQVHLVGIRDVENADFAQILPNYKSLIPN